MEDRSASTSEADTGTAALGGANCNWRQYEGSLTEVGDGLQTLEQSPRRHSENIWPDGGVGLWARGQAAWSSTEQRGCHCEQGTRKAGL